MAIEFHCKCGRPYRVGRELAGKKAQCKSCGRMMRIPIPRQLEPEPDVYGLEIALEDSKTAPPVETAPLPRVRHAPVSPAPVSPAPVRPAESGRGSDRERKSPPRWVVATLVVLSLFFMLNSARRRLVRPFTSPSSQSCPRLEEASARAWRARSLRSSPSMTRLHHCSGSSATYRRRGLLAAYLTPDPGDGRKHPAIIWITGGDCNTIDRGVWAQADPSNDQTAGAFREAGIVMMFPSLRGGNDNPGWKEGFFGEVDDVLAAAEFLRRSNMWIPRDCTWEDTAPAGRWFILVAESSDRFRAVFSFGPVDDVSGYGSQYLPINTWSRPEIELRSPIYWLHSVRSPTFVFEGTSQGQSRRTQGHVGRLDQSPAPLPPGQGARITSASSLPRPGPSPGRSSGSRAGHEHLVRPGGAAIEPSGR